VHVSHRASMQGLAGAGLNLAWHSEGFADAGLNLVWHKRASRQVREGCGTELRISSLREYLGGVSCF